VRAHEAGALHANLGTRGPAWLRRPDDVNTMDPALWSATARRRTDGVVEIGGVALPDLAAEFGTPSYVLDEHDFRVRARAFREAFEGFDVFYAGKAFLASAVVRWAAEEGLYLDVCSGGELALALRAGIDPAQIGFHGNNKSEAELTAALQAGVGRIIVDSFFEIDRLVSLTESLGLDAGVLVRVTAGVEAHTHEYIATAHEDQKFGFSIGEGEAFAAVSQVLGCDRMRLLGLHSHIGSQIFDLGVELPELDLGGGFGMPYTSQDDPQSPQELADGLRAIVDHECRERQVARPRLSIEPGRAIVGPAMCTLYRVGTVKDVALDAGATRRYISVDGGMSDNIRTALYDADYACTVASRRAEGPPILSRLVGKHCEAGDIVVKDEFVGADVTVGDLVAVPGTGAYCRSMASNYNHLPRPAVVAVRDGQARLVVRRETEEDLLRLDVL
jgi:diaminopimelate decarboxylase